MGKMCGVLKSRRIAGLWGARYLLPDVTNDMPLYVYSPSMAGKCVDCTHKLIRTVIPATADVERSEPRARVVQRGKVGHPGVADVQCL